MILAFNGKRLDTTSMDETLRCFKLAAPDIENIAVPQIIVIAGNIIIFVVVAELLYD